MKKKQKLSSKLCPSSAVMIHDDLTADDGHRLAQKLKKERNFRLF